MPQAYQARFDTVQRGGAVPPGQPAPAAIRFSPGEATMRNRIIPAGLVLALLAMAVLVVQRYDPLHPRMPRTVSGKLPPIEVYFSPSGGCTDAVVREIRAARHTILVRPSVSPPTASPAPWPTPITAASTSRSSSTRKSLFTNTPWPTRSVRRASRSAPTPSTPTPTTRS